MKKINVCLIVPGALDSTSLYRGIGPYGALSREYDEIRLMVNQANDVAPTNWAIFQQAHCVVYQRPFRPSDAKNIAAAKDFGLKVAIDYDDDLTCLEKDNPVYIQYMGKDCQAAVKACCEMADAITVSTQTLKDSYVKKLGINADKIFVIKNGFDKRWFSQYWNFKKERQKIIAWRGSNTHRRDCEEIAKPFNEFMKKREDYSLYCYGWINDPLTYELPENRFRALVLPVIEYHAHLHSLGGHIGIVPLVDNAFNRAKSNIGFIELVSSGHLCITKDLPEFQDVGAITFKSQDDFLDRLTYYTDNIEQGFIQWKHQFNYAFNNLTLDIPNKQRLEVVRALSK